MPFIKSISLNKERVPSFDIYPFNIEIIKNFDKVEFNSPVTFLIGENGIGKSTLIEAIAVSIGLNAEGGNRNFNFSTNNTTSILSDYITVARINKPKSMYFLRAESFYNLSSEVERIGNEDRRMFDVYGGNLHHCSHGESFLQLVENKFYPNGLYILDEPEAALSPQRQMTLLCLIDELVKEGCQFIIATHSPILISYREGEILDLNNNFQKIDYKDTEIYSTYKLYLDNPEKMQHELFDYKN